jgi:hypothetical protein
VGLYTLYTLLDWQGLEWGKGGMTTWLWGQQMGCLFCVQLFKLLKGFEKVLTLFPFPQKQKRERAFSKEWR